MAKEIQTVIKLQIAAGKANPAPPIGPALGQHGVNIGQFVQQFNAQTGALNGMIVPVEITVYKDKTFTFLVNLISGYHLKYYNGMAIHLRYNVMRWHPSSYGFGFQADGTAATYVNPDLRTSGDGYATFLLGAIQPAGNGADEESAMNLTTRWLGLDLPHPFMPGASPLVDDLDTVRKLAQGFEIFEIRRRGRSC